MPTYVYETIDPSKPLRRFEIKQSMKDEPLKVDPETGEPVRRVISGGYGVHVPGGSTGPSVGSVGGCVGHDSSGRISTTGQPGHVLTIRSASSRSATSTSV